MHIAHRSSSSALLVVLLALATPAARAADGEVSPGDDLQAAINALGPGDELVMHDGTYELTGRLGISLAGTADQPIVIRAADGEVPHIHREGADQNIVDIDAASYLTFRGIEFSGGSAGIRMSDVDFLTIEDCHIHDTGDVAVRANDGGMTYEGLQILRNHIHDTNYTGEGMYLGCNDNGCQVFDSVIAGNYVHHTNGPTIEQGDGIELKEGSHDNVIRDNVIHDTNYPCILTYSAAGNGGPNVLERNVMWNCGDHGIQSAADATIRNNIILSTNSDGIAMQSHQSGSPSNLLIVHNTVLHAATAISVRDNTGMVTIANNAIYSAGGDALFGNNVDMGMIVVAGNVGVGGVNGLPGTLVPGDLAADFVAAHHDGAPPIDVYPADAGALVGAGDMAYAADDDFNCRARPDAAPDAGAYGWEPGGNPGWTITADFKDCDAAGDGGSTGDDGGSDGADDGVDTGGPDDDGNDASATMSGGGEGVDASATLDGGDASDGSGTDAGADGGDGGDEGCGCRADRSRVGALALVLLVLARRRRKSV